MSIQFSNTVTKAGIIQRIEDSCGFNDGDITGNATRLAKFTAKVNSALDEVTSIALKSSASWQFDDVNHTDYPIMTTDLVSGQQDYSFTSDGSGNLVLDIFKVMIKLPDGTWTEIKPVDRNVPNNDTDSFDNTVSGTPTRYDKLGNGIFLDAVPDYSSEDGLKVYINRESTYFLTSDTTKKAGFAGLFHDYLYLKPSYEYARDKGLSNVARLEKDVVLMQEAIRQHYATRERDIKRGMRPAITNSK